jgi:hypothetical protein
MLMINDGIDSKIKAEYFIVYKVYIIQFFLFIFLFGEKFIELELVISFVVALMFDTNVSLLAYSMLRICILFYICYNFFYFKIS